MEPFVVGSLVLFGAVAAGAVGFLVAISKASRVQLDLDEVAKRFQSQLREERESDRRHYAEAFEEMTGLAESVRRHAAKVDGAKGGRPNKSEEEAPPLTRDQMRDQVLALARRRRGAA